MIMKLHGCLCAQLLCQIYLCSMPFYLVLADGVLFQQVLVTAADFEDVFTLIFLNTHL